MAKLIVIDRSGTETAVEGEAGLSVMENVRLAGFDELLGLCGGCCSCATCHVYIDDAPSGALPSIGSDEDELLDSSDHRKSTSRLSCQIPFYDGLDGLRVRIAPED